MNIWRKKGDNFNQEVTRTRSNYYRKPPLGGSSNRQKSVPSWEKCFCSSVGSVPWKKLLETKKVIHLYENIMKWNDSAGNEAFQNAKKRFFAHIHGLPCDIEMPDPDLYIDKIDWNSQIDQNLILELDLDSGVHEANSNDEEVVIFDKSVLPPYQGFSAYGWGDSDDEIKKNVNMATEKDGNQRGVVENDCKWWGWSENDDKVNGGVKVNGGQLWGEIYDKSKYFYGDAKNERQGGNARYISSYKTSRFDNQRSDYGRKYGNGRKSTAHGQWKSTYSPGSVADKWSVKKQVS